MISLSYVLKHLPVSASFEESLRLLPEAEEWFKIEHERLQKLYGFQESLCSEGCAGCDEAGRGPLAGPVAAAAVILEGRPWIPGLNDSKRISENDREIIFDWIKAKADAWHIETLNLAEIESLNIRGAALEGMKRSVEAIASQKNVRLALIDGNALIPGLSRPQQAIVKGDARVPAIAAASILAKVSRDRIMLEIDKNYPHYGFAANKGYGTAEHLEALQRFGPCPWHRRSFGPVKKILQEREHGGAPVPAPGQIELF
ncbi:ribonuclease HII [bacterium]|nr:ribonuclease HII [bacterium]